MHILLNTDGVSFQWSLLHFGLWGFAESLLPVGQCASHVITSLRSVVPSLPPVGRWVYDKSREIINTSGVSLRRHSIDS